MNNSQEIQIENAGQIEALDLDEARQPFAIGDWRVMPELNRIQHRKLNANKQLEPRLVNLLCHLVNNQDRVISRDELVQVLWPRVIVNENSLTRAVSELRKQLRHDDSDLQYIETIPKKGYRLLLAAEELQQEHESNGVRTASIDNANSKIPKGIPQNTLHAVAAVLAVTATIALYPFGHSTNPESEQQFIDQPTLPLLSDQIVDPEADYMGGEFRLSTMDMGEHDNWGATDIPAASASVPVVSSDGNQYAYISYNQNGSTIYLGSLSGAMEPVAVYSNSSHLYNLAWSPLGDGLLFAKKTGLTTAAIYSRGANNDELYNLDLDTYVASKLTLDNSPAVNTPVTKQSLT
jgi:DNA-binding winged helix-turn-helix (wHTH) protein